MSFFANLKIAAKVLVAISLMALLTAGMTAFALVKSQGLAANTQHIVDDPVRGLQLAAKVDGAFTHAHQLAYEILVETDPAKLGGLQTEFEEQFAEAKGAAVAMKPLAVGEHEAPYRQMSESIRAYEIAERELYKRRVAGERGELEEFLQGRLSPIFDKSDQAISTLNAQRTEDVQAAAAQAQADARQEAIWLLISGAVGLLAVGGLAAWIASREIAGPVVRMTAAMQRLAGGETTVEIEGRGRRDEVGAMAEAVQVFKEAGIEKVRLETEAARQRAEADAERARREAEQAETARQQAEVVASTGKGLSSLADGDLTHRIHTVFPAEYEQLRSDFNTAMEKLQDAMLVIARNTDGITSGAGEISQAADDLSRRTEQQAATLEETAAALDEITATVKRSAEGAAQANQVVEVAKGDAERSGEVVRQAVEAMSGIEKSASEISQIIGVIDEIAFQTNLLALNAGVEAARAGDAGKGFAVVASEVRALAQRSAEAAKEIKTLISTSSGQVKDGVGLVGETGEALQRIVTQVSEITGLVSGIAASAREQSTALGEVNTAVNQMDQMTQQNAAMVEQSTAASHSLADEARALSGLVSRFRIGSSSGAQSEPTRPASRRPAAARNPVAAAQARIVSFANGGAATAEDWSEF